MRNRGSRAADGHWYTHSEAEIFLTKIPAASSEEPHDRSNSVRKFLTASSWPPTCSLPVETVRLRRVQSNGIQGPVRSIRYCERIGKSGRHQNDDGKYAEGKLANKKFSTPGAVQDEVSRVMTDWYGTFGGNKPPSSELLLGMRLQNDKACLYFCEPPSTFIERVEGYAAAGVGASVTDPLNELLFGGGIVVVQAGLRRVAYLMYHAKKMNAWCGKRTMCYVIGVNSPEPIQVNTLDMSDQEGISQELDFLLHSGAVFALESSPEVLAKEKCCRAWRDSAQLFFMTSTDARLRCSHKHSFLFGSIQPGIRATPTSLSFTRSPYPR